MKWVDPEAYGALLERNARTSGVRDAVLTTIRALLPAADNVPTGRVQDADRVEVGANRRDAAGVAVEVEKIYSKQLGTAGAICMTLVGETHRGPDGFPTADEDRARTLLTYMTDGGRLDATGTVVLERGMEDRYRPYPMRFVPASILESDLGPEVSHRDHVLAGYLFLTLAGGDQSTIDNVVVLRGCLSAGFLDTFEDIAASVIGVDRVARRPRTLVFADSLAA